MGPFIGIAHHLCEQALVPQGGINDEEASTCELMEAAIPQHVANPAEGEHTMRVACEEAPPRLYAVKFALQLTSSCVPIVGVTLELRELGA
mmetsp:Transcript_8381/g.15001  ORF Transcript_8381/g.15001 Transcript_8381/m.15001 type:complete len:91 (-) Transcript_8381:489-761(-)